MHPPWSLDFLLLASRTKLSSFPLNLADFFFLASLPSPRKKLVTPKGFALHHLPGRRDNFVYILLLALAPLINLWISGDIFRFSSHAIASYSELFGQHWIFALSEFVVEGIGLLLLINLITNFFHRRTPLRKTLLLLGFLASVDLFLNILTLIYGIYHFKIASYVLLLISVGLYISLNLIFMFWYWYIDFPSQVRRIHRPELDTQIAFPRDDALHASQHWVPLPIDYLYYTIMTSNTLGPPENHSPIGRKAKLLQIVHSSLMLVLLVIFVSRAVNTLS